MTTTEEAPPKPQTNEPDFGAIERHLPGPSITWDIRWLIWQWEEREDARKAQKWTKVPYRSKRAVTSPEAAPILQRGTPSSMHRRGSNWRHGRHRLRHVASRRKQNARSVALDWDKVREPRGPAEIDQQALDEVAAIE